MMEKISKAVQSRDGIVVRGVEQSYLSELFFFSMKDFFDLGEQKGPDKLIKKKCFCDI